MPAKNIGSCLSAPVTNLMAFASRCEIQGRASRRRLLSACSKLSIPRNRAVWDLGCRSAGRSLKRITEDCGRAPTCHVALFSASLHLLIRPPRPDGVWPQIYKLAGAKSARCWRFIDTGHTIPTILVTAFPNEVDRARALNGGVMCYLGKPVDEEHLTRCVREALRSGSHEEDS